MPRVPEVLKGNGMWQAVAWIGLPGVCLMFLLGAFIYQNQAMMKGLLETNADNSRAIVKQVEITGDIKQIVKHHDDVERDQKELRQKGAGRSTCGRVTPCCLSAAQPRSVPIPTGAFSCALAYVSSAGHRSVQSCFTNQLQ